MDRTYVKKVTICWRIKTSDLVDVTKKKKKVVRVKPPNKRYIQKSQQLEGSRMLLREGGLRGTSKTEQD